MKRLSTCMLALLIGILGTAGLAQAQEQSPDEDAPQEPEIIGVFMHADWCGGCQKLKPKLNAVKPQFKSEPVLFTGFDKTDEFTKEQSRMLAEQMGLTELYEKHKGRTAYVVLIDAETKEEVDILKYKQSEQQLKDAIASALESR